MKDVYEKNGISFKVDSTFKIVTVKVGTDAGALERSLTFNEFSDIAYGAMMRCLYAAVVRK